MPASGSVVTGELGPRELRVEVLDAADLIAPEYRLGDITSSLLSGPQGLLTAVYVELTLGDRTVKTGHAHLALSTNRVAFSDERMLFRYNCEHELLIQVRDNRGIQAIFRGDPLVGEAALSLGPEIFDCQLRSVVATLARGTEEAGRLMLRYQLLPVDGASVAAPEQALALSSSQQVAPPLPPPSSSPPADDVATDASTVPPLWVGRWRLDKSCSDSYEPILESMGVNYFLRKAADMTNTVLNISVSPTHVTIHVDAWVSLEDCVPLDGSSVEMALPVGSRLRGSCHLRVTKWTHSLLEMCTDFPDGEGQLLDTLAVREGGQTFARKVVKGPIEVTRVFRRQEPV